MDDRRSLLADARRALGIEHLVLSIHDASFPNRADEETGRGSPYSRGARDLLAWAQDRGFTGVQFGPQGETSRTNPSPYDGTAFAKSILSASLWPLAHDEAWEGILSRQTLDGIVAGAPAKSDRVAYAYVYEAHRRAIAEAHQRVRRGGPLWRRFEVFRRAHAAWLDREARYEALSERFGTDDWQTWPHPLPEVAADDPAAERFAFGQFLVHVQHEGLLAHADEGGLRLFGDLQIGTSHRDRFGRERLYLDRYRMGAPPSRTNPDGQPWGYPVLVPGSAEARAFLRARAAKIFAEFHGLRIDHPHGLVCPWVYDATAPDPLRAVQGGARLFESPDLPDHPELRRYAIARPDQIDRRVARHTDGWVTSLDDEQVAAYGGQLDVLLQAAHEAGRPTEDVLLEVLSTCPYPLQRVMRRHGFGRFRVIQKANPLDPGDVYLTANAVPGDWVMIGNHDTPPIWRCVEAWTRSGRAAAWCDYLEARLGPGALDRAAVERDPSALAQPLLADLFACEAGRVLIFFADLLGSKESYNAPGVVSDENWNLRIGNDFAAVHAARSADGLALDVPRAIVTALRSRGGHQDLAARLDNSLR